VVKTHLKKAAMRNIAFLVGIVLSIAIAVHFAFDPARAGKSSFFLIIAIPNVIIAILGVLRAKHDGVLKEWFRVRSGDFTRGFAAAALLFGGSYAFSRVVAPDTSPRVAWLARLYLQLGDPADLRKNVALVVVALIVMAVAEELVWRGLVVGLLEEQIGSSRAWIWSAVLYAVAHLPTIWALRDNKVGMNPIIILAALSCGLVWGFMARRFERLLPGIFSHVLFDWTVVMMFRLWGSSV
jgi:uncharacterized protein